MHVSHVSEHGLSHIYSACTGKLVSQKGFMQDIKFMSAIGFNAAVGLPAIPHVRVKTLTLIHAEHASKI